jgi:hypothetical protein
MNRIAQFAVASILTLLGPSLLARGDGPAPSPPIRLDYEKDWLTLSRPDWPGPIRVHYLEAYCRAGSTDADWIAHTVIPHETMVLSISPDHRVVRLRDRLADGLVVDHTITAEPDVVRFHLVTRNSGKTRSEAHWAQPCVRLSAFLGFDEATSGDATDYLPLAFIGHGGRLTPLSGLSEWATKARYVPGQVWCPKDVPRTDVNPRPLSPIVPDHGLIGAYTKDRQWVFATAWQPYQELFQGVARCLHSDFRLGGVAPGATREVRGAIYVLQKTEPDELLKRFREDFPEQR